MERYISKKERSVQKMGHPPPSGSKVKNVWKFMSTISQ